MTDDELASRRGKRSGSSGNGGRPNSAGPNESGSPGGSHRDASQPPVLWMWFSTQHAHSNPRIAAAVQHVKSRWPISSSPFARIDRALEREDSEHLMPFRQLLDEYRLTFEIDDADERLATTVGTAGLMIPVNTEYCEKCGRVAVPGTAQCVRHGGGWISESAREEISNHLRDSLMGLSIKAVRTLDDLVDNAASEHVRLLAAQTILDRTGIEAAVMVKTQNTGPDAGRERTAAEVLLERVDKVRGQLEAARTQAETDAYTGVDDEDPEIQDAEIVDDVV